MFRNERGAMGRIAIGAIATVVVAAGIVGYLLLSDDGIVDDSEGTTQQSSTPSPESTLDAGTFREAAWGTEMIQVTREVGSGKEAREAVQIYFVAAGTKIFLRSLADDCATSYLEDFDSVACYAFDSQKALEYAEVDRETGGMAHVCWRAFASVAKDAEGSNAIDEGQYEAQGCP